jgi:cyclopropane fatty-acyl-phospholipid synthase-like methyltransferase/glycosyltransferase involved in cell wall biosynthesis
MEEKILNNDKIYEGYKGDLGKEFQLKVQKRFFWMSQMVYGNSILDVGCSSGIFPILMAREGKQVLGIDLDKSAIEKAEKIKRQEEINVQRKVQFLNVSMNDLETTNKYDTIILSEMLEHVFYPTEILEKATTLLNNEGVIIITIPFGINSYFDHKKTYYLWDIFQETNGILEIIDMDFFDEWIGVKCIKSNKNVQEIPLKYLKKMEKTLYEIENRLHVNYSNAIKTIELGNKRNVELEIIAKEKEECIQKLKEDLKVYIAGKTNFEERLARIESYNEELESKVQKKERENYELIEKLQKITFENNELNNKAEKLEEEKEKNMKQIKMLSNTVKGFNQRKIIKILRKLKKIKEAIFLNRIPSIKRKLITKMKNEPKINMEFYNKIDEYIKDVPDSNGSNYYDKIQLKVGIITDEYMFNYYKDAIELSYISYTNYKETVNQVDLVLFVSCWHGMNNNDWRGMTSESGKKKVIEVLEYAKKQNKMTIFQTIEDPSNYEVFLPIAKCADYIFTTATEMIQQYKKDTKNENVFLLDYGINPQFHNPIGFREKNIKLKKDVFFAGSWAPRYKERCQDAQMIFDGVIESNNNLIIADRNCNISGYEFPIEYSKYIIPAIDHEKLQKVHKLFDWALNLNSIKYSSTMCAMRVYELQAIGDLIISNYSIAVNNKFPNIFTVKNSSEIHEILNAYNEVEKYKMQVEGIRNVMSNHTVYDKLNYILECIGKKECCVPNKKVLIVCDNITEKIKKSYKMQTYKDTVLIELKELTNKIVSQYDYIAYMSDDIDYQRHYIEDMINAFKYTASDYITISSKIKNGKIEGINHNYVSKATDIRVTVFDANKYDVVKAIKNKYIEGKGYSIDPFSITNIKYSEFSIPELSVIVPIYNNGKFLLYKCFNSLLRSSIFSKMEIILVDDGSTDEETIETIKEIENKYANVKTYSFKDGGSGSASRPRNKGVELATSKYITYLDPDNEAINDGYTKLLNEIKKEDYDFAYGSIIKLSDREVTFKYFSENRIINNPKQELIKKNFKTNSIQACVIKRSLIVDNKIENPVGAAGQDSLFFQELMINAKKVFYMNLPIHIYYAARTDSIVNTINHKFFKKFLIMEKYQVQKLKQYDLLNEYIERRYEDFMNNWYLTKLELIEEPYERRLSLEIINEIKKMYEE